MEPSMAPRKARARRSRPSAAPLAGLCAPGARAAGACAAPSARPGKGSAERSGVLLRSWLALPSPARNQKAPGEVCSTLCQRWPIRLLSGFLSSTPVPGCGSGAFVRPGLRQRPESLLVGRPDRPGWTGSLSAGLGAAGLCPQKWVRGTSSGRGPCSSGSPKLLP